MTLVSETSTMAKFHSPVPMSLGIVKVAVSADAATVATKKVSSGQDGCLSRLTQIDARARLDVISLRQADVDITIAGILPCDGEWLACDNVEAAIGHVDVVWLGLCKSDGRQQGEDQSEESHCDELLDVCVLTNVFCGRM